MKLKKSVREMFGYTCKFSTFEIVTLKSLGFEGTMYDD